MATTHTTSSNVKPCSDPLSCDASDVCCCTGPALLPIGAVGKDVIASALAGYTVDIRSAPRITGNDISLQIGTTPAGRGSGALQKRLQAFRARRISPGIEEIEVERARQALELDSRGLDLGFRKKIEDPRPHHGHDESDDGDDDEDF